MNRKRKRVVVALGIVIAALCGMAGGVFWWVARAGASELETWIGNYLLGAVQTHLSARIQFTDLDYQYPQTVVIRGLTVVAANVTLLETAQLRLELAKVPRRGEPVVIQELIVTDPFVRFAALPDGRLCGWPEFLGSISGDTETPTNRNSAKLSDFLRLRRAEIRNGSLCYEPGGTAPPMVLSGLQAELASPPSTDDPSAYQLVGTMRQPGLAELHMDARLNLDTGNLLLQSVTLSAALSPDRYNIFPPAVQQVLAAHAMAGQAELEIRGQLKLGQSEQADLTVQAALRSLSFANAGGHVTIPSANAKLTYHNRQLDANFSATGLGGTLDGVGSVRPSADDASEFTMNFADLAFDQLLVILPASIQAAAAPFEPHARLTGRLQLALPNLRPTAWTANTHAVASEVTVRVANTPLRCADLNIDGSVDREKLDVRLSTDRVAAASGPAAPQADQVSVQILRDATGVDVSYEAHAFDGRIQGRYAREQSHPEQANWSGQLDAVDARMLAELAANANPQWTAGRHLDGSLSATYSLIVGPAGPRAADGEIRCWLRAGGWAFEHAALSIPNAYLQLNLQHDRIEWRGSAHVFEGMVSATGDLKRPAPEELNLHWNVTNCQLHEVLETLAPGSFPGLRGDLSGSGSLQGDPANWPASLHCVGSLRAERARLVETPVLGELFRLVNVGLPKLKLPNQDRGQATFNLDAQRVELESFDISYLLLAVRGRGSFDFDGGIDLNLNAELRADLPFGLGLLTRPVRQLQDRVMSYHVSGTARAPRFEIRPLGFVW